MLRDHKNPSVNYFEFLHKRFLTLSEKSGNNLDLDINAKTATQAGK